MNYSPEPRLDVDILATLLIVARDGDAGAFDRLIAACRPLIERQARRDSWRAGDVDDIVQEVCLRLFEHAPTIREPRSLLSWLAMVTKRSASQVGRRSTRLVPTDLDDNRPSPASTEDQAMRAYERREVTDGVRAALARLNAEDRRVLLLLEGDDDLSVPRGQPPIVPARRQPRTDAATPAAALAGRSGRAAFAPSAPASASRQTTSDVACRGIEVRTPLLASDHDVSIRLGPNQASARAAALAPHIPCAPAPGGVDAEHRYVPGMPVKYGSTAKRGLNRSWPGEDNPPTTSPPT